MVKILDFKSNRKNLEFPKSKYLHESLKLRQFWRGVIFGRYKFRGGGEIFQPKKV